MVVVKVTVKALISSVPGSLRNDPDSHEGGAGLRGALEGWHGRCSCRGCGVPAAVKSQACCQNRILFVP